ncbi:MAG TPA: alpha-L-arabinofuranosidase C-terminal domain-containing protein [Terracidiphilus sp.]|jgi:alpha-N-arabinofuranosidase|nr:alpha-L-arabinofuranosidase C-terminal domain-containing protein [Terracidiphilus sp.]
MSEKTFARIAATAVLLALASPLLSAQAPATLTIHASQPVHPVSPTLYGLMTEEINYSYDGGLYAEMVRNRTFRADWMGVPYWYLVESGNAAARMTADKDTGPSDALKNSVRLDVEQADVKNQAGMMNVGWWGMALRPNTSYKGSFYAKAGSADLGPVTASFISDNTGKAVASATVSAIGTDWKQYEFVLKTGAIEPSSQNHLALTVGHAGTLWLNLVSLFPPTYHDRVNGNRIDLMEKMAAMHPQFLRFPGGNYLEGDRIVDHFDWKKTIGPLVDRPTHPSPWGYQSSDGMGLLEFLGWCEDLRMNPVLAVYAGYSLKGDHVNPGADLEPYVQDALDEIEYTTGGPDTKWGAERIKNGHPAPFKLTYVEIGNEEWFDKSGSYDERYTQFAKAIKAKYPDLQLIATAPVKSMKPDVLDEHFYVRATQNFHDATHYDAPTSTAESKWDGGHYDKADRNGPKIFVGEWATREGFPTPDFGSALGDAAWMTGLERNSDIVVMAAYAPLLVEVDPGGMQWETDLIGYNAMKSYGSPAYYAQVLFAHYLGDQLLGSKLEGAGPKLFYSITGSAAKKKLYLKLVNGSTDARSIDINIDGAKLASTAKVMSLNANDMRETNSIGDPDRIVPIESALHDVSGHFNHSVPGLSIQVIELNEQ